MNIEEAKEKLQKYGQEHVLKYYSELSDSEKQELIAQIEDTDFSVLANCKNLGHADARGEFAPLAALQVSEIEKRKDEFMKLGVDEENAVNDACKIEHVISSTTFAALKKHLNEDL